MARKRRREREYVDALAALLDRATLALARGVDDVTAASLRRDAERLAASRPSGLTARTG